MAKIILLTGSIVGYAYLTELFIAWYSANKFEQFHVLQCRARPRGQGLLRLGLLLHDVLQRHAPQIFWIKSMRTNYVVVFIVCMFVNVGMWFERFVIIVTSLAQDYLPSSWGHYSPSWVEVWTFIGTFGIFLTLFLLFMRFLPMIAMSEVKIVTPEADPHKRVPDSHVGVDGHHS
jgi:molybdopterin-containing oxidoreductase family membrane subunit